MSKRLFIPVGIFLLICGLALGMAGFGVRSSSAVNASWGFDTSNLDKTCKACDDFYQFAMGGWIKSNPIPPEYPNWGTFTQLADKNQKNVRQVLEDAAAAKGAPGSNEQKIGDFYSACMDT